MKKLCYVFLLLMLVSSCGSKKRIVTNKSRTKPTSERVVTNDVPKKDTPTNRDTPEIPENSSLNATEIYILKYNAIAMDEMRRSKIPASITLAQGILESGSGRGRLSVEANNHFGIKCHGWNGQKIYHDDDRSQECFRKYDHAYSSFEDHSAFLTGRGRYAKLFELRPTDYKGWAKGLRAAGYATDRRYPEKLISLIERYQLYKYDEMTLSGGTAVADSTNDSPNTMSHQVVKGDTLYSLSKRYHTTVEELKRLNGLKNNDLSLGQVLIIKSN